jgi:hypothetical protein
MVQEIKLLKKPLPNSTLHRSIDSSLSAIYFLILMSAQAAIRTGMPCSTKTTLAVIAVCRNGPE